MASEEDRLDQLLKAARQQLGEEVEDKEQDAEELPARDPSMPSIKDIVKDFEEAGMEEGPADHAVAEAEREAYLSGGREEDNAPDPNAKMSDEDIAALFAAMNRETPAEEEASAAEEEAAVIEEAPSSPVPEAADPNAKMSDDDIAALFAAMNGEVPEADETSGLTYDNAFQADTVSDMQMSQPRVDGSNNNMSQAEIEAMLEANGADDLMADERKLLPKGGDGDDLSIDSQLSGLGLDDIEKQLAAAEAAGLDDDGIKADEDTEFDQIMANLGEDDLDLSDIGSMIEKSDSGELVDPSIAQEKEAPEFNAEEEEEGEKKKGRKKREKKKKEKEKPEKDAPEKKKKEKKQGLFSKLMAALFTEEEEDSAAVPEASATKLSDENAAILSELDAEDDQKGKKKKEKKKKEKKPKEEKPKKEKKVRPKKEKKPAEPDDSRHIPKRYISRTIILALSILVVLLLLGTILPGLMNMSAARKAYYDKDYKTAFLTMYGKELNDSDKLLYQRARLLVMLDRKYESYEHYFAMGMKREALDALLQGLKRYDELEVNIKAMDIETEALGIRLKMLDALSDTFGVGEAEAMTTLKYSQADYTGKLEAVISGVTYIPMEIEILEQYGLDHEEEETKDGGGEELPDLLPEEIEYLQELKTESEQL